MRESSYLVHGENKFKLKCPEYGEPRYEPTRKSQIPRKVLRYFPLTPRLRRLYYFRSTAKDMTWHSTHVRDSSMVHPSDTKCWQVLNDSFPEFKREPRNVVVGLSTDGFNPHGRGKDYSCWPVMITPYNLPPSLCNKRPYMFLTMIIPGPTHPSKYVYVYTRPLVDELKSIWNRFLNNVFQGKVKGAGIEVGRFLLNTTLGIAGVFDVATDVNLVTPEEDFGQTLGFYEVKPGPYLVLPFMPPFTVRDFTGYIADIALNPINWLVVPIIEVDGVPSAIAHKNRTTSTFIQLGARVGEIVNERSRNLEKFQGVEEAPLDLYSAVRNAYLQKRAKEIKQ